MSEIVLFHHVQGLTDGVRAFAEELRSAGHQVHTPDLFDGQTFATIDEGMAHARSVGFGTILERGVAAAEEVAPGASVFGGFSMGAMPAQQLAQTRPGARAALLLHACLPVAEFSASWPDGVAVQVHAMADDPFFAEEGGDIDAARELVAAAADAELHLYPGSEHLFTDSSLPAYDADATGLVLERVRAFLDRVG